MRRRGALLLGLGSVAVAAAALAAVYSIRTAVARTDPELTVLSDSVAPLRRLFNDPSDRPRLVAIVSPSCPRAWYGFHALETAIVRDRPAAELSVIVVWTRLLPGDVEARVTPLDRRLPPDPRIRHLWDPAGLAGRALAATVGLESAPFVEDVYLFWPAGDRWEETAPPPASWVHQLAAGDPQRRRHGEALGREIDRIVGAMSGGPSPPPEPAPASAPSPAPAPGAG